MSFGLTQNPSNMVSEQLLLKTYQSFLSAQQMAHVQDPSQIFVPPTAQLKAGGNGDQILPWHLPVLQNLAHTAGMPTFHEFQDALATLGLSTLSGPGDTKSRDVGTGNQILNLDSELMNRGDFETALASQYILLSDDAREVLPEFGSFTDYQVALASVGPAIPNGCSEFKMVPQSSMDLFKHRLGSEPPVKFDTFESFEVWLSVQGYDIPEELSVGDSIALLRNALQLLNPHLDRNVLYRHLMDCEEIVTEESHPLVQPIEFWIPHLALRGVPVDSTYLALKDGETYPLSKVGYQFIVAHCYCPGYDKWYTVEIPTDATLNAVARYIAFAIRATHLDIVLNGLRPVDEDNKFVEVPDSLGRAITLSSGELRLTGLEHITGRHFLVNYFRVRLS